MKDGATKLEVKRKVGSSEITFQVEYSKQMDFFKELKFIYSLPTACGKCGSQDLKVNHRVTKNKSNKDCDYPSIDCRKCKHFLRFGINQNEEKTLFTKGYWEPPFNSNPEEQEEKQEQYANAKEPVEAPAPARRVQQNSPSQQGRVSPPAAKVYPNSARGPSSSNPKGLTSTARVVNIETGEAEARYSPVAAETQALEPDMKAKMDKLKDKFGLNPDKK